MDVAIAVTKDISTFLAWWGLLLLFFALLGAIVAFWLLVWPAWKLLALSLYGDTSRRYRPALRQLRAFFTPGLLRKGSLIRSARMRIELELLSPPPEPV